MSTVKDIVVKVIPYEMARDFIKKHHYSGKTAANTFVSFGCFIDNALHGAVQIGPSIDKRKSMGLVKGTKWNEFVELARMAFDEMLPRNSESRCISIILRMLKKNSPHLKWIVSYADGTQCGDGTIYRASGFKLVAVKKNAALWKLPGGEIVHELLFHSSVSLHGEMAVKYGKVGEYTTWPSTRFLKHIGAERMPGFQLKYIYFLDRDSEKNLTVPVLPFSEIDKMGARMYLGVRQSSN